MYYKLKSIDRIKILGRVAKLYRAYAGPLRKMRFSTRHPLWLARLHLFINVLVGVSDSQSTLSRTDQYSNDNSLTTNGTCAPCMNSFASAILSEAALFKQRVDQSKLLVQQITALQNDVTQAVAQSQAWRKMTPIGFGTAASK